MSITHSISYIKLYGNTCRIKLEEAECQLLLLHIHIDLATIDDSCFVHPPQVTPTGKVMFDWPNHCGFHGSSEASEGWRHEKYGGR